MCQLVTQENVVLGGVDISNLSCDSLAENLAPLDLLPNAIEIDSAAHENYILND